MHHRVTSRIRAIRRVASAVAFTSVWLSVSGCTLDDMVGAEELPPDVTDPAATETRKGAIAAYNGALVFFRQAFGGSGGFVSTSGVLTDELESSDQTIDARRIPEGGDAGEGVYSRLQRVRGQAAQAIGLLTNFAPGSEALVGHMYAIQAYAEIFLAELFCSGIPLSTLDYKGDFTYKPGSSTEEVYRHALALLDTAATLVADSARLVNLVRVGRARALLGLGEFAEAARAVADVPDEYRYAIRYSGVRSIRGLDTDEQHFATIESYRTNPNQTFAWNLTVGDREGRNGLDYVSSGDPRTQTTATWGENGRYRRIFHPSKYPVDGSGAIVLASGIEARLVEAEAALREGRVESWLATLNHLRRTMWPTIEPAVSGPLPDLTDPGSDAARVDLLFRERAFWLFLTGQRQGDLRRLIRHYGRSQDEIYPVGPYPDPWKGDTQYGSDVDLPVPNSERISNPYYKGCIARGA